MNQSYVRINCNEPFIVPRNKGPEIGVLLAMNLELYVLHIEWEIHKIHEESQNFQTSDRIHEGSNKVESAQLDYFRVLYLCALYTYTKVIIKYTL